MRLRKKIARWYNDELEKVVDIPFQEKIRHTFQMYTISTNTKRRNRIRKALADTGVTTKIYFEPIHKQPYYKYGHYNDNLSMTENISKQVLSLPIYPDMTSDEVGYVCDVIKAAV